MNILVTGVGSTLGYGILETIKHSTLNCQVSGTDYLDTAVGLYQVDYPYILPDIYQDPQKENIWLLCSGSDVIWVIGKRMDDRYKITDKTIHIIKATVQA